MIWSYDICFHLFSLRFVFDLTKKICFRIFDQIMIVGLCNTMRPEEPTFDSVSVTGVKQTTFCSYCCNLRLLTYYSNSYVLIVKVFLLHYACFSIAQYIRYVTNEHKESYSFENNFNLQNTKLTCGEECSF